MSAVLDRRPELTSPRRKETSYVKETNEVREMRKAVVEERKPILWYEILQGALDYNDNRKGLPRILIYTNNNQAFDLPQFLDLYKAKGLAANSVERVEVRNYIRDHVGLKPTNITFTEHVQEQDTRTLGEHGRGLSIAATAICTGLGEGIDFLSHTKEMGTWYGKGEMHSEDPDEPTASCFSLLYQKYPKLETDETVVGIDKPKKVLLDSLVELSQTFLPANPDYRFSRLQTNGYIPNQTTLFTEELPEKITGECIFSSEQRGEFGFYRAEARATEPRRVEVLPKEIAGEGPYSFVYVDGLKVKTDQSFTLPWSFWGFHNARYGYDPGRSNDSTRMVGHPNSLISESLRTTSNPTIVGEVIKANIGNNLSYEGSCFSSFSMADRTKTIIAVAWMKVKHDLGISDEPMITESVDLARTHPYYKHGGKNKPVVLINSSGLAGAILKSVRGSVKLEDVVEEERIALEKQLEEERIKAKAELEKQRTEMEAEMARKLEEQKKVMGIAVEAARTDETIKLTPPENKAASLYVARQHLLHELAYNRAMIVSDDEKGNICFEMENKEMERLPRNAANDLGELANFYKNFVAILGDYVDLEVRIAIGGKAIYFSFEKAPKLDPYGNITVYVKKGELVEREKNRVQILFKLKSLEGVNKAFDLTQQYHGFYENLVREVKSLLGPSKRIDYDLYSESQYAKDFPPSVARRRAREKLQQLTESQLKTIESQRTLFRLVNEKRKLLGLPPLPFPKELQEQEDAVRQTREETRDHAPSPQPHQTESTVISETDKVIEILGGKSPDQQVGLSRKGTTERGVRIAESGVRRQISPDFSLFSGLGRPVQGHLISHINPEFSIVGSRDYVGLDIPSGRQTNNVALVFNKPLKPGFHSLYFPPGFVPSGYFHPKIADGAMKFSLIPGKNMYGFAYYDQIPAGLTFYYKKNLQLIKHCLTREKLLRLYQ